LAGESVEPDEVDPLASKGRGATPDATRLLHRFTMDDVKRALASARGSMTGPTNWRVAEWNARRASVVALSYRPVTFGAPIASMNPHLAVLDERDGKLVSVVESKIAFTDTNCANDGGEPVNDDPGSEDDESAPALSLDLAPYKMTPSSTALGVRLHCRYTFPAGEGDNTYLALFEVAPGTLRLVFETPIETHDHQRVNPDDDFETKGVVIVQKTAQKGHFDWLLQTTQTGGAAGSSKRIEKTVFVWNDERYTKKP
jgi:hypothetical protein